MKYTDLATRLEDLDNKLTRNDKETSTTASLIRRLESQTEPAKERHRKLRAANLALHTQREATKRELNVRLG
jgi:predicted nuclease with TOPRIM domain